MQHRRDGKVFATYRAIDDHLQAFDGGEYIHSAPVAACTIVVKY
jgi:hypothetical protein